MDYRQIKVKCKTADLDKVCAVMSMIDNGLMIEDYSDIEDTFKNVYADLIEDELFKAVFCSHNSLNEIRGFGAMDFCKLQ